MPTLLLADDSLTTQKVVNLTFADEGINVVTADDGDTALELFDHHKPDIVLADVNIPGLNGYEVCENIRKRAGTGNTPVILLVGSFEPFDVEHARRAGANDYLTKPFGSIRRLVATVTALLDNPKSEADESIEHEETTAGGSLSLAEPNVTTSTNDIEQLYSASFAETVEMPHAIAQQQQAVNEHQAAVDEHRQADDPALDDELIETTYTEQPPMSEPELELQPAGEAITVELPAAETGVQEMTAHSMEIFDLPDRPALTSTADTGYEEAVSERTWTQSVPDQSQIRDFAFEELREEAYFEPEAESFRPDDREPSNDFSPVTEESTLETIPLPEMEPPPESAREPVATPWDSKAEPAVKRFGFDEGNLLEVPDSTSEGPNPATPRQPGQLPPEIIEQIVRATASQISDELVREIAERVVPKVVEQVTSRNTDEETEK